MKQTILDVKEVCKSFANEGEQLHIINNVNFSIYKGDFTVVMGASGSGKSTLLYNISGMDRPTSGSVYYNNEDITKLSEKKIAKIRGGQFGFVFQQIHLVSNLSLYENSLASGYVCKEKSKQEIKERADMLFEKMNIADAKNRLPSQVSGGEAQRAAIARAVINTPQILFADEPTGSLNRKNTDIVLDLFTDLNNEGQTILMVTHDIKAAIRANRLLYLDEGKICGELELPLYNEKNIKDRELQVNSWLSSMSW